MQIWFGSLEDDLPGNIVSEISQDMQISAVFMRDVMSALVHKFNLSAEMLLEYLYKSPLFSESKKPILQAGIQAYFDGNTLVAIHLLIPQVEAAIRNLVEKRGGSVLKQTRNAGSFHLKILDELLRDPITSQVLGEDMALYFRILFTDQRGWNLRNDVSHGISPIEVFDPSAANLIVHALLCLALKREVKEEIA